MASALIKEISDDFLVCQICLETFRQPKSLECLHSFCEECLRVYCKKAGRKLECPTCRRETPLPSEGVQGLKTNFLLIKLVDTVGARNKVVKGTDKIPCDSCSSGAPATSRCVNCADFLCQQCVRIHRDLKVFRGHVVGSFADIQSGSFDISPTSESPRYEPTCNKHAGEKMRFYCKTCEEAICHNCTVLDHQKPEHEIRDIHSAVGEQREAMKALQDTTEEKLTELEKTSKSLESELKQLDRMRDVCRKELKQKVAGLTSAIEKIEKQCEEKIQKQFVLNEKTSTARKQEVEMAKCRLESTREFVANILLHGSDAEIAATFKQVEDSILGLTSASSSRVEETQGLTAKRVDFGASPTFQLLKKMKEMILEEQRSLQAKAWGEKDKHLEVGSGGAHAQPVTSPQDNPSRPWDKSRILLKGVPKQVTEDELCLNLTILGITDVKPHSLVYGSRQGTVMVECSDVISDLDGKLRALHRTKFFGSKVTAEKVLVCDCVEVHNLPPHASDQSLFTYFNKQRRSGGGGVVEVKVDDIKRTAMISFQNYKVVERLLERHHAMGKVELVVKPFYPCLGQTAPHA